MCDKLTAFLLQTTVLSNVLIQLLYIWKYLYLLNFEIFMKLCNICVYLILHPEN